MEKVHSGKVLRSQFVTLNSKGDRRGSNIKYHPFAFTEQGVAMLSAVLRSERAIKVSIEIMNAFVQMRHYLRGNIAIANRLDAVENRFNARFVEHDIKFEKIDENFSKIFNPLDASPQRAKEGVFFKGQIFDAYAFFQDIIKTATKEIVIIDGYVDLSVMDFTKKMHDRFLIIDNKELYHIGASLKDLGKACFAFEKMEDAKTLIPAILAAL
ncbi:ORF6N domain-containing protein [uncultured Fibrobacter sp.]|uniref:ORF6N domain-containing protein n=1 Tax=uncultured Fibrobacter sp. TaxID=261512 RepID=UPI0025FB139E|nr:ORF6N domain-containing protein [uncultured Fibrobacter sp.]